MFSMFKKFKSKPVESETIHNVQQQQEQFDAFLKKHREKFDKAMESRIKADALIRGTMEFIMSLCITQQDSTQYEQAKGKLRDYLLAVQEDEILKHNVEVQKLVNDIYSNMDDRDAMGKMIPRLEILVCTPQVPDILNSFNLEF